MNYNCMIKYGQNLNILGIKSYINKHRLDINKLKLERIAKRIRGFGKINKNTKKRQIDNRKKFFITLSS